MAPPVNLMLRYYQSDRPRSKPSPSLSYSDLKGKSPMSESGSSELHLKTPSLISPSVLDCPSSSSAWSKEASNSPELQIPDPEVLRKRKRAYEMKRHFQDNWGAQFPWVEAVQGSDGKINQVKCRICSTIEGRDKLLVPKIDSLWKHAGRRRAPKDLTVKGVKIKAGQHYFIQSNSHVKNEKLYLSRPQSNVAQQVESQVSIEKKKKLVQLKCLFHILSKGKPMTDYVSLEGLCGALAVPNNPVKHWSDSSGWELSRSLEHIIAKATFREMFLSPFFSVFADEVTTFNNQQWLSVHGYVVKDWVRFPILLCVAKITMGQTAENIHDMIVSSIRWHGNMTQQEVAEKLVCFSADGASVFQGCRNGVLQLLHRETNPYVFGVHCCAHRTNLAADKLSDLSIVHKIEKLVHAMYKYFHKSPKRYAEFEELADQLELEAQPMLKDVTTRWISLLKPMERVLSSWQLLIAKMSKDDIEVKAARKNMNLLLDLQTLLSLPALLPLFIGVNDLIKFAQDRCTYIVDFVSAIKMCQAHLYWMYVDPLTSFTGLEFEKFADVVGDRSHLIAHEWRADMNTKEEYLSFRIGDHSYATHSLVGDCRRPVSRDEFKSAVAKVKSECKDAAQRLIVELDFRFPDVDLLNALGICFPQYWVQQNCEEDFQMHLYVLKKHFCETKNCFLGEDVLREMKPVTTPLNAANLESQAALFKISMKSNSPKHLDPKDGIKNPFQSLWKSLHLSNLLCTRIPEYFKVAQLAVVMLVGSVEDERTFSSLSFIRNKLRNRLHNNLDVAMKVYSQGFYDLNTFPYLEAYEHWKATRERIGAAF